MNSDINQPAPKMGKFKTSTTIVSESWALLKKNKEMMYFPVFSSISTLFAMVMMATLYYSFVLGYGFSFDGFRNLFSDTNNGVQVGQTTYYSILLVYYIVVFFIVNFFEAGLIIVAQGIMSGQNVSFRDGLKNAYALSAKIFEWSLISATVGVILRFISDKSEWLGKVIAGLLGLSWSIATFFSLPALVISKVGVKESFKESAAAIKKTWGETVLVKVEVGAFFFAFLFVCLIFFFILSAIFPFKFVWITLGALFVLLLLATVIVSSTLSSIFKLVLFNYAKTGIVPNGFSRELVAGAIVAK